MLRDICGWLNINSMRAEKVVGLVLFRSKVHFVVKPHLPSEGQAPIAKIRVRQAILCRGEKMRLVGGRCAVSLRRHNTDGML